MSEDRGPILAIAAMVLIIVLSIIAAVFTTRENRQALETYETAESLLSAGDYEGALELLTSIQAYNYQDTSALIKLCNSLISCSNGDYKSAYESSQRLSFPNASDDLAGQLDQYIEDIENDYENYLKQLAAEEEAAYREKVTTGVPFIGMSESDIGNTSLGQPASKIRHNTEIISGERYYTNLYDFYEDGIRIFSARCIEGEVTDVWDMRNKLTSEQSTSSSSSKSSSGSNSTDPYNASNYAHPDDFYYDHYDDFIDFEEAEDYWNAHN
ncbi:MAG: hypothetical protein LUI10_07265 [Lachnospiraceae bacterium]|nr:hypothetical protein [Lachnospiraceae bacterium]